MGKILTSLQFINPDFILLLQIKSKMPKLLKLTIISIFVSIIIAIIFFSYQAVSDQQWIPVRGGIPFGISGMTLIHQPIQKPSQTLDLMIVHDNKQPNQGRLAIISINDNKQLKYFPLKWPSEINLPLDLEALASIPGTNNLEFIAVTSAGKAYHLKLDAQKQHLFILGEFELPDITKNSNFESFGLQNIDGKLIAIWAHRGESEEPAKIYWGILDLKKYQINLAGTADFQVPFPGGNVRHISDIKVDNAGIVYISAASDAGNDGPFESAVYVAGYLGSFGNKIFWRQNDKLFPIYRDHHHKIEGLELIPGLTGGVILGTDDENLGSYVYMIGN